MDARHAGMKLDALRFSIGPWYGRYSSVWRVWSEDSDVYLAVRSLVRYMKISLHQSGGFRIAFTKQYNDRMVLENGKDAAIDRALLKWQKIPISGNEVMQALDIHFPLSALSLRHKPDTKNLILLRPDRESLGDNDSVTVKVLFHRSNPDNELFSASLKRWRFIPGFWVELSNSEYVTIAFHYSKQLPLSISEAEMQKYAAMFHESFTRSGKQVGEIVDDLTIQVFQMGRPPAIYNIGGVSVHWVAEKHFSIDVKRDDP
jgi:hypothetical protein